MAKKEEVKFRKQTGKGYLVIRNGDIIDFSTSLNLARTKIANSRGNTFTIAKVEGIYTKSSSK